MSAAPRILHGDCLSVLESFEPDSIDTVISDPPYALRFMGARWDYELPGVARWKAILRVVKPGAALLAFGGTRTYHRLICEIEDAGWEIRDCLMWVHGQGFPKSLDLEKAGAGAAFHGWGTALKPAWEPIVVAMKPLDGTFAANAKRHGVAGLSIDVARIGWDAASLEKDTARRAAPRTEMRGGPLLDGTPGAFVGEAASPSGRWPANVLLTHHEDCVELGTKKVRGANHVGSPRQFADSAGLDRGYLAGRHRTPTSVVLPDGTETVPAWDCVDECPVRLLDEQSGAVGGAPGIRQNAARARTAAKGAEYDRASSGFADKGGASRFFYCGKATKRERGEGNDWPTVKPLNLMRYLCRLTKTPTGGVVLDPFMGSGSTLVAAMLEGRTAIGIDRDEKAIAIARSRLTGLDPVLRKAS